MQSDHPITVEDATTAYNLNRVRELIRVAKSIAVLTGAGISAESGIPTFRGNGGLWREYRPEELATPEAFQNNPDLVWDWYEWRRELIVKAEPNEGHRALAALESAAQKFTLITQNVDNLHERAGSRNLIHLHGEIFVSRCVDCCREVRQQDGRRCQCGGMLRPGVVWFGEALSEEIWKEAEAATNAADVFLVVGTSAVVFPSAGLITMARKAGAKVVEINLAETPFSNEVDFSERGKAGELLPQLVYPSNPQPGAGNPL